MPRAPLPLFATIAVLFSSAAPARAQNRGPDGARAIVGVELNSAPPALLAAASAVGARCSMSPGPSAADPAARVAYVCSAPAAAAPFPATATYWYEGGTLGRVYLVASHWDRLEDYETAYRAALRIWSGRLGRPTSLSEFPVEWQGARPLPDRQRREEVVAGRAALRARWSLDMATLELALRGENGRPILVAALVRNSAPPPPAPGAATVAAPAPAETAAPGCEPQVVRDALLDLFPPADEATRKLAARKLAECRVGRAAGALESAAKHDPARAVRSEARIAKEEVEKKVVVAEVEEKEEQAEPEPRTWTTPSPSPSPSPSSAPAAAPMASAPVPPPLPPPAKGQDTTGTSLTIATSTIAGATLMRNLGLMGGQGVSSVTPQLLLGTAGAVIGFGTSWGLSRFGFKPTVAQAAWFANVTAWGTLAGLTAWSASGSTSPKLQYGALALGEAVGLGLGALTAHKWRWTPAQIALADGLLVGAALSAIGVGFVQDHDPKVTTVDAIGLPALMVGAAVAAYHMDPTVNDLRLMTAGALVGGLGGAMLATGATNADFLDSRQSWGGLMLGAGAGFLGGAVAGAFTEIEGRRVGVAGAGMLAGSALGLGLHMSISGFAHADGSTLSPEASSRWGLGAGIGGLALSAASFAYAPRLRLGPGAPAMTVTGALYGGMTWWLAFNVSGDDSFGGVHDARFRGGLLAGATLGGLGGLISSQWFNPDGTDQMTAAAATALGMMGGIGVVRLTTDGPGAADGAGILFGAGAGFVGGALVAHHTRLRGPDVGAGIAGIGFGALVGTLLPRLDEPSWRDDRTAEGAAWLGAALGGVGAATAAHLTDASGGMVKVPFWGATFGLGAGLGAGLMFPCDPDCTSQGARIGTVAGIVGGAGLSLAADLKLHLSDGLGDDAGSLGTFGAAFGIADGLMLAAAIDESGVISDTPGERLLGGALMLGSAELAAGLVASKLLRLRRGDLPIAAGGRIAGGLVGLGTAMLFHPTTGRPDTVATLGGSLAGLGIAAAAQVVAPLEGIDGGAIALGASAGAMLGAIAPTLAQDDWSQTSERRRTGGLLLGLGGGAFAGVALRQGTGASPRTVALTAFGGLDGLVAGAGLGLLAGSADSDQGVRIGMFTGTSAGLAMGALGLPHLPLDDPDAKALISASALVGGWTGAWLPSLGHEESATVDATRTTGGLLAGLGLAAAGSAVTTAATRPSRDLMANALTLDAIFTGAGAGAGALASTDFDAPVWGMLTAGTTGLVLGGALHDQIEIDEDDAPFLALAAAEGLWLGGWLPNVLQDSTEVTSRERLGGLALGGFGGLGLATLASGVLDVPATTTGYAALGSAIGTALGGGIALVSPSLGDQRGAAIMLGGTTLGLGVGAALAPRLAPTPAARVLGATAAGAALGAGESLLFAWSARADQETRYGGAALIGGGIGAALGLAAAATPPETGGGNLPAAAGFAAWGAWTGAFAGSLVRNDPHEVVLGGLIGANVGFATGYALLSTGAVAPRDFGWLSLFGALGTVAGAGAGAPFATRAEPAPVLAGLAIGPVVGMLAGALLLPKLRTLADPPPGPSTTFRRMSARAVVAADTAGPGQGEGESRGRDQLSSDVIESEPLSRRLGGILQVTQWSPLIGALPGPAEGGPPSTLFGLTGLWK